LTPETPVNVSLTEDLEAFVNALVGSGLFRSRSEVVRHALRELRKREVGPAAWPATSPVASGGLGRPDRDRVAAPEVKGSGRGEEGSAAVRPAPPEDPIVEAAVAAEIEELVAPLRRIEPIIREVVVQEGCADPRIMILRKRDAPRDSGPSVGAGMPAPKLEAELLVKRLDVRFPGTEFVLIDEIHKRCRVIVFVRFEDRLDVAPRSLDVVRVLPL